jgi:hypothetical protein
VVIQSHPKQFQSFLKFICWRWLILALPLEVALPVADAQREQFSRRVCMTSMETDATLLHFFLCLLESVHQNRNIPVIESTGKRVFCQNVEHAADSSTPDSSSQRIEMLRVSEGVKNLLR